MRPNRCLCELGRGPRDGGEVGEDGKEGWVVNFVDDVERDEVGGPVVRACTRIRGAVVLGEDKGVAVFDEGGEYLIEEGFDFVPHGESEEGGEGVDVGPFGGVNPFSKGRSSEKSIKEEVNSLAMKMRRTRTCATPLENPADRLGGLRPR